VPTGGLREEPYDRPQGPAVLVTTTAHERVINHAFWHHLAVLCGHL